MTDLLAAIFVAFNYTKGVTDTDDVGQHPGDFDVASTAVESKRLAQDVTEKLVKRCNGSGRNVIVGNWFTLVSFMKSFQENYGLTYVTTIHKNKEEIPYEMLDEKTFPLDKVFVTNLRAALARLPHSSSCGGFLYLLVGSTGCGGNARGFEEGI